MSHKDDGHHHMQDCFLQCIHTTRILQFEMPVYLSSHRRRPHSLLLFSPVTLLPCLTVYTYLLLYNFMSLWSWIPYQLNFLLLRFIEFLWDLIMKSFEFFWCQIEPKFIFSPANGDVKSIVLFCFININLHIFYIFNSISLMFLVIWKWVSVYFTISRHPQKNT